MGKTTKREIHKKCIGSRDDNSLSKNGFSNESMIMNYSRIMLRQNIISDFQAIFGRMNTAERKGHLENMVFHDPMTNRWHCQICNHSVSRKTIAIDHIEGEHIKLLSYPCTKCDKTFTCLSARRTHTHKKHRDPNKMSKSFIELPTDIPADISEPIIKIEQEEMESNNGNQDQENEEIGPHSGSQDQDAY